MGFEMKSRSDKPKTSKAADAKGYGERFMESRLKHIYTPEFKAFIRKANQYKNSKAIYGNLFESARNSKINERNQRIKGTYGAGDPTVLRVQASLVMAGYDLGNYGANGVDGDLGSRTLKAIAEFKKTVGLGCNDKLDGETIYALDFITEKGFTKSEIELIGKEARSLVGTETKIGVKNETGKKVGTFNSIINKEAQRLKIDEDILHAVILTESSGKGFQDGNLIIRFEAHKFDEYTKHKYSKFFSYNKDKRWLEQQFRKNDNSEWQYIHGKGQKQEWEVFSFALEKDEDGAYRSISMGMGQIMGFNYKAAGFNSPKEMFLAFSKNEEEQIKGLIEFIENDTGMLTALRNNNLEDFVKRYNGPGQVALYVGILKNHLKQKK